MAEKKTYDAYIGIDPGVHTGFAIWKKSDKKFVAIHTMNIAEVQHAILIMMWNVHSNVKPFLRIEDARQRTWFGNSGPEKWKGAGSIMRDCKMWEEFCTHHHIDFEMVHPKNILHINDATKFKLITKWKGRTSEHARIAAMLVFDT